MIILTGPTAAGKTELSLKLAERLGGEIISADSMQVYRGMDIGTAKITRDEMRGIPHHLIDVLEPEEDFNVAVFKDMAKAAAEDIISGGHVPIVVGGTGFYIQALLYDISFNEEADDGYRLELEKLAETESGRIELYELLTEIDKPSTEKIHANNIKRVIRALEFYHHNGYPISEHNESERQRETAYDSRYFVLTMDRQRLYERINLRVDMMMEAGLVDEVRGLIDRGLSPEKNVSMQGIGYKEMYDYLTGKITRDAAVETIKQNTRHFAKRQLTWFRRERDVIWVDKDTFMDEDSILEYIIEKSK